MTFKRGGRKIFGEMIYPFTITPSQRSAGPLPVSQGHQIARAPRTVRTRRANPCGISLLTMNALLESAMLLLLLLLMMMIMEKRKTMSMMKEVQFQTVEGDLIQLGDEHLLL